MALDGKTNDYEQARDNNDIPGRDPAGPLAPLGGPKPTTPTSDLLGLVKRTFCNSEVASIIAEAVRATGAGIHLDPAGRAQEIISTLRVAIIRICSQGGRPRPIANLYIEWPFDNDEAWSQLTASVARTNYQDSLLGSGLYHPGWTCTICHGADHPLGLCPLPLVPGWIRAIPIPPIIEYRNQLRNPNGQTFGRQPRGQGQTGGGNRGGNGRNYVVRGQGGFSRGRGGSSRT
jgi:hypothetical protein